MRIYIFIFLMFISFSVSANEKLKLAEDLYNREMYDSSAKIYESLIGEGYASPGLYYNTGNAYFRSENYILATWYFVKAKKISPIDEDIQNNLNLAKNKLSENITGYELSDLPWLETVIRSKPVNYWSWAAILLINAGFISFILILVRIAPSLHPFLRIGGILLLLCGSICFTFSWYGYKSSAEDTGMIMTETSLYESPSATADVIKKIPGGSIFRVTDSSEKWYFVENESMTGWIKKENFKLF